MDTAEVNRQLRALVEDRLFGNGPWTSDDPAVNHELSVFVRLRSTWLCRFQFCQEAVLPDRA
jgi:hypothetical protein